MIVYQESYSFRERFHGDMKAHDAHLYEVSRRFPANVTILETGYDMGRIFVFRRRCEVPSGYGEKMLVTMGGWLKDGVLIQPTNGWHERIARQAFIRD